MITICACSSSTTNNILNIFFDGVSPSDSVFISSASITLTDSTINDLKKNKIISSEYYIHAPYEEKMCESCHDVNASYKKIIELPDLCYQCHDNFQSVYKNIHYPVEAGECNACHHPHQSKLTKLLLKPVRELCGDCHDLKELFSGDIHNGIGDAECTDCHDPHGSNDSSLLK